MAESEHPDDVGTVADLVVERIAPDPRPPAPANRPSGDGPKVVHFDPDDVPIGAGGVVERAQRDRRPGSKDETLAKFLAE